MELKVNNLLNYNPWLTCPFTPKVLKGKERAPTPYSSVVFTSDLHLSLLKSLGARHTNRAEKDANGTHQGGPPVLPKPKP
jgi:hypothetical protein